MDLVFIPLYMRYFLISLICFAFIGTSLAQPKEISEEDLKPIGKISYVYKSLWNDGGTLSRGAVLIFNEHRSLFYHSRGEAPAFFVNGVNCIDGCYEVDKIGRIVFKDFEKDSLQLREIAYYQGYVSSESIPQLEWELSFETRRIGSFTCQMATTEFRGRNYTAWFTTDIPISDGPWKFSGLPGMILEVSSNDGQYAFLFKSIEMPVSDENFEQIVFTDDGLKVDFKTFVKADELEFEKSKKRSEAQWLSAGGEPGGFKMTRTVPDPIELNYDNKED